MSIFVNGIAVSNFRGIGEDLQKISDFRKINFFIGANNSGKSTVLLALKNFLKFRRAGGVVLGDVELNESDMNISADDVPEFGIQIDVSDLRVALDEFVSAGGAPRSKAVLLQILEHALENNQLWLVGKAQQNAKLGIQIPGSKNIPLLGMDEQVLRQTSLNVTGSAGSAAKNLERLLSFLIGKVEIDFPDVSLIPAIRSFGNQDQEFELGDLSGKGLINRLAELQSPSDLATYEAQRSKFDAINALLKEVTAEQSAEIDVPADRTYLIVSMNGRRLPLANLGTGIHQTVMLGAFCTMLENQIVCIEEPELHLHPELQKKLIRHISDNTTNQYFIATHSASFIDTEDAAIYSVSLDRNQTVVSSAVLDHEKFSICRTLGYRASDIIQSNFVIWVEGPSERIYLKDWLNTMAPELVENVHFSIMFYGGRLLNHLSAADDEVTEFIKLRTLNRNFALLMDSDREKQGQAINATKKRVRNEIEEGDGLVWITKGREIENYVPYDQMQAALACVHPRLYGAHYQNSKYEHAFYFRTKPRPKTSKRAAVASRVYKDADKVKLARKLAARGLPIDILDLRAKVSKLADAIKSANDL